MSGVYTHRAMIPPPARAGLIRVATVGVSRNRGRRAYSEHRHTDHELVLVVGAGYRCTLDGAEQPLAVGDALLVVPGEAHADSGAGRAEWATMRFRLTLSAPRRYEVPLVKPGTPPALRRWSGLAAELEPLVAGIAALSAAGKAADALAADALATAIVWRLAGRLPSTVLHPRLAEIVAAQDLAGRIAAAVAEEAFAKLSVTALAARLSLSPSHLAHACARDCGRGPAALMQEVRLDEARRLICAGAAVGEAAQATGFGEPAHFTRAYKRQHGHPPSADTAG